MQGNTVNDFFDKSSLITEKMANLEKKDRILLEGIMNVQKIYKKIYEDYVKDLDDGKEISKDDLKLVLIQNAKFSAIYSKHKKNLFYRLDNYYKKSEKISNHIKNLNKDSSDFDSEYNHLLKKMKEFNDSYLKFEEEYNLVFEKITEIDNEFNQFCTEYNIDLTKKENLE